MKKKFAVTKILILLSCLLFAGSSLAMTSANYSMQVGVFNAGGATRSSANYGMKTDAIGQGIIGTSSSTNYVLRSGSTAAISDILPPTGAISINEDANFTNSTSLTLNLICDDSSGTGCFEVILSNDGVFDTEIWEAYSTSKSWTILSGDGLKTVYVQFKDNAGNISTTYSDTITLDTVLPTTTVSLAGATYLLRQWVSLTADETATIYYTTDGSLPTTASDVYSSPILIDASTNLQFFAMDSAGNEESIKSENYIINRLTSWTKQLGSTQDDMPNNPAIDSNGNVYISGYTYGSVDGNAYSGGSDIILAKYDNNGNKIWTRQIGTAGLDFPAQVAVDSNDYIYITGRTDGDLDGNVNQGSTDIFLIKYDTNGNRLWTKQMGEAGADEPHGLAIDDNGNFYIAGKTDSGLDGNVHVSLWDTFLMKLDNEGNKLWTRQPGVSGHDAAYGIAVDLNGNAYITGGRGGAIFTSKYDTDGNMLWTKELDSTGSDLAYSIKVDGSGNAYIGGETGGPLDGNPHAGGADIFVAKYDTNGTKLWVRQMGTPGFDACNVGLLNGNVYLAGRVTGALDGHTQVGGKDLFLAKYDTDGTKQWTKQFGTLGDERASGGPTFDIAGQIYILGNTDNAIDGNSNSGLNDLFLMKLPSDDTVSPTGTVSINSGASYSNATTVALELYCDDGPDTGCIEMQFSNYSTSNWSTAEAYATTKTWNLESVDGVKTVYVKFKDYAGNWSDYFTDTIVLDTMAPLASSITSPVNGFLTLDNTPTLTGTAEANSTVEIFDGVSSLGVTSANGSGNWSFTSGILSDALHTLTAKATDAAGNTSLASAAVNITVDTISPTGTITINSGAAYSTSTSVTLTLTCNDSNGCAQMKFSNAQAHGWSTPEPYSNTKSWTLSGGDASKTVYVWFGDNAGNGIVSIFEADSDTIMLDTTLPITSASPTGGLYGSGQSVTLSTSADGTIYYTTDSSTPTISSPLYSGAINISSTTILKFFAMDNAGNQESVQTATYTIDTVAPSGSISINSGSTFANSTAVILTLTASDIDSSVTEMQLSNDGSFDVEPWETYALTRSWLLTSGDGEKSVYVKYKDAVGNITSSYSDTIILSTFSAPDNPTNLSGASNDDGSISVAWSAPAVTGISGYNIYRDDVKINSNLIESTNYTDSDTTDGTSYTYKVTSVGLTGKESSGATVSVTSAVDIATAPSMPEGVKIENSGTGDSLKVAWLANSENDLAGYKVHWGTASGDYTNSFDVGNVTSYTISALTEGIAYYIAVSAYDADLNESEKSVEHTEAPELVAAQPDQPSNFIITEGNEYLKLDWIAAADVSGYMVYIGETDGLYSVPVRTTDSTYTFENLQNGKSYYVAVASYDIEPDSRYTTSSVSDRIASSGTPYDNTPPMVPLSLTATDTGIGDSVVLSWAREESFDIAGYVVAYKETGASIFEEIESVGITWNYAATGLTQDTSYSFFVYSYDKSGNFSEPNGATATPTVSGSVVDLIPPDSPLLGAVPGNQKLNLLITPPADSDVDYYNLYIYNLAAGKYMPIASTSALSYEHSSGVENGKALVFVATAVDTSGNESGYSDPINAVPSELAGDIELEKDPPVLDRVDGYDIIEIANGFGRSIGHPDFNPNADLNGDGIIDGEDVTVLAPNHGKKKGL